ncbi:type 1 glutamine amidotransferase domain-containing protein [Chondromyces apiculatus]|uniref:ThiJ/PfpI family protein n=1 Tax=Chondromyces apiculatus DSM 436 TaxID=1192034 RepID=A0A017TAB0_9BACT|nr:type 1 glutamine amidotransferase domain-containing protein [Chondromyces apiculatus]EYF05770.1 ThiJ/PfpI family protein [Chondromyces apiculatus DSM 436]
MTHTVTRGLKAGAAMTAACGATMMVSSAIQRGTPWAGLNAMATAVGVRRRRFGKHFDADVSVPGLAVLTGGLLAWGIFYEGAVRPVARNRVAAGVLSGLGGYALDRWVLPDWVLPNFRKAMGSRGTVAKYVALGVASALATEGRGGVLAGKRIAVLAADGFEQVELTLPVKALRAKGATVEIVSLRRGRIVGMHLNVPGSRTKVDRTVEKVNAARYDGLFVPGGFIGPDLVRQSEEARDLVRAFDAAGKPIAVICHGPWVLASAEILKGRQLTSWPGIRDDLVHAGAVWRNEAVVVDGNLVSSRGPQDLPAFTRAMVDLFAGRAPAAALQTRVESSSPPRLSPPALALHGVATLPKVARALRTVGLVAVTALVARRAGVLAAAAALT